MSSVKTSIKTPITIPTHIYLVRHGQKRSNLGDPGLTPLGLQQAQATALYFSKLGVDTVFSSPLVRARETASIIARETQCELKIDDRLTERANWGDLTGQTFPEFLEMWERATQDRDWRPPTGDTSRHAGMRMTHVVFHMAHQQKRHAVLVSSGGVICDLVRNMFSPEILNALVPNFSIETDRLAYECSITELTLDREAKHIEILRLVDTKHLPSQLL